MEIKLSWLSEENWNESIESGLLPVLAIWRPEKFYKTPIHFPELSFKRKQDLDLEENLDLYWDHLQGIDMKKILHKFDILSHLSCASGVTVFTKYEEDPFREVLGQYIDMIK